MNTQDWMKNVQNLAKQIQLCWMSLKHNLTTQGGAIPAALQGQAADEYINGTFFFQQIEKLVTGSMECLLELPLDGKLGDPKREMVLVNLARYQRSLFEALPYLIMLSDRDVLGAGKVYEYFLHCHLWADVDKIRRNATDIKEFSGVDKSRDQLIAKLDQKIQAIETRLDSSKCVWRLNAKDMLLKVMKGPVTDLERAALGLTYYRLYSETSSRIHLNMSALAVKLPPEVELRSSVEQTLVLSICAVLRCLRFFEKGNNGQGTLEGIELRKEYESRCPDSYLSAAAGPAEEGDLVLVEDITGNYYGLVATAQEPSRGAFYPGYEVVSLDGSLTLWHSAPNVTLAATKTQQEQLLKDAVKWKYLSFSPSGDRENDISRAVPELVKGTMGMINLLCPLIDRNSFNFSLFAVRT